MKPISRQIVSSFAVGVVLAALFVAPLMAFAQVGYGGGGGGPSTGSGQGGNGPISGSLGGSIVPGPGAPLGQVLGASAFEFTQTLLMGMQNEDVVELQKVLISLGFLNIPGPTGFFGPATEAAVKAFQSAHGLEPVGVVGPLTRALLNQGVSPAMGAAAGMTDAQRATLIQQIQTQLQSILSQLQAFLLQH